MGWHTKKSKMAKLGGVAWYFFMYCMYVNICDEMAVCVNNWPLEKHTSPCLESLKVMH